MLPSEYVAKGWCQGYSARDADGEFVDPASDHACCWCLIGALEASCASQSLTSKEWRLVWENLCRAIGTFEAADWNDDPDRSQAEVIAALQDAERKVLGEAKHAT